MPEPGHRGRARDSTSRGSASPRRSCGSRRSGTSPRRAPRGRRSSSRPDAERARLEERACDRRMRRRITLRVNAGRALSLVVEAPSRSSSSRCPGNRRCCSRAACGRARRRRRSSASRARRGATRGSFAAGARGSSVLRADRRSSPSTPPFDERLSSVPSRFSSPFASLCFCSYETRSRSVNPS